MKSNTKQDRVKELYLADLPPRACSVYYYLFHKCYNKDSCFPSIVPSQQKWTQKSFKKRNESQYFVNLRNPTAFIPRFA